MNKSFVSTTGGITDSQLSNLFTPIVTELFSLQNASVLLLDYLDVSARIRDGYTPYISGIMGQFGVIFDKKALDTFEFTFHKLSRRLKSKRTKKQIKRVLKYVKTVQQETGAGSDIFEIARTLLFTLGTYGSRDYSLFVDDIASNTVTSATRYWAYSKGAATADFMPNSTSSNKFHPDVVAFGLYQMAIEKYCVNVKKTMADLTPEDVPNIVSIVDQLKAAGVTDAVKSLLYIGKNGETTANKYDCADPSNPKKVAWQFPQFFSGRAPPVIQNNCCHKK